MKSFMIVSDGISYGVVVESDSHRNEMVRLSDIHGDEVSYAEIDHNCENVHIVYIFDDGTFHESYFPYYELVNNIELAKHMAATHPIFG